MPVSCLLHLLRRRAGGTGRCHHRCAPTPTARSGRQVLLYEGLNTQMGHFPFSSSSLLIPVCSEVRGRVFTRTCVYVSASQDPVFPESGDHALGSSDRLCHLMATPGLAHCYTPLHRRCEVEAGDSETLERGGRRSRAAVPDHHTLSHVVVCSSCRSLEIKRQYACSHHPGRTEGHAPDAPFLPTQALWGPDGGTTAPWLSSRQALRLAFTSSTR